MPKKVKDDKHRLTAPNVILPLSKRSASSASIFSVGGSGGSDDGVTSLKFPHNSAKPLVEIYASGTATEEFWYTNTPDKFVPDFSNPAAEGIIGHGPFREVQLLIDGMLAGIAFPYAVVFTGGINPLLWRPQASFGAFDQPTYLIDITPFLGTLTDDKEHEFQLQVVSGEKNHTINRSWFISGEFASSSKTSCYHKLLGEVSAALRTPLNAAQSFPAVR